MHRIRRRLTGDAGMNTAEYAVGTLAAVAFSLVWFRAVHRNRLVDAQLTPRQQWATLARFSMGTIVYALTIAVSFAAPAAALAIQFLLALYYLFEQVYYYKSEDLVLYYLYSYFLRYISEV